MKGHKAEVFKGTIDFYKEKYKSIKIDLACGNNKRGEDWIGIDISSGAVDANLLFDLNNYPWPIDEDIVDEIYCSHYVEHIPHVCIESILEYSNSFDDFKGKMLDEKDGFIKFFNELYRILKPGAKATIIVPHYMSVRAFGDPTHTRYVGDFSFYYLNKEWRDLNKLTHYGIFCDFDCKFSYLINEELTLKSKEVREEAFKKEWNAINDIIVELTKR